MRKISPNNVPAFDKFFIEISKNILAKPLDEINTTYTYVRLGTRQLQYQRVSSITLLTSNPKDNWIAHETGSAAKQIQETSNNNEHTFPLASFDFLINLNLAPYLSTKPSTLLHHETTDSPTTSTLRLRSQFHPFNSCNPLDDIRSPILFYPATIPPLPRGISSNRVRIPDLLLFE